MKKMNLYIIALISILSTSSIFAQDYLTKITHQSCECLSTIEQTEDREQFNLELGLCIIDASMPYKKELKKDHNIDLENIDEDGTRLGELIGLKMAGICPEEILKIANGGEDESYDELSSTISGTITKVEKEQFIVFSIKEDSGKTTKFYWIYYIESNVDLPTEYSTLIGKKVEVYYYESDLFDARINEYKSFNIIEEINLIK